MSLADDCRTELATHEARIKELKKLMASKAFMKEHDPIAYEEKCAKFAFFKCFFYECRWTLSETETGVGYYSGDGFMLLRPEMTDYDWAKDAAEDQGSKHVVFSGRIFDPELLLKYEHLRQERRRLYEVLGLIPEQAKTISLPRF